MASISPQRCAVSASMRAPVSAMYAVRKRPMRRVMLTVPAGSRYQTEAHFRQLKPGIGASLDACAERRQFNAGAHAGTVHAAANLWRQPRQQRRRAARTAYRVRLGSVPGQAELVQITTGAERRPRPIDQYLPDVVVCQRHRQRFAQRIAQRGVVGVAFVRTIQGQVQALRAARNRQHRAGFGGGRRNDRRPGMQPGAKGAAVLQRGVRQRFRKQTVGHAAALIVPQKLQGRAGGKRLLGKPFGKRWPLRRRDQQVDDLRYPTGVDQRIDALGRRYTNHRTHRLRQRRRPVAAIRIHPQRRGAIEHGNGLGRRGAELLAQFVRG